jgi:hypothetical protein
MTRLTGRTLAEVAADRLIDRRAFALAAALLSGGSNLWVRQAPP